MRRLHYAELFVNAFRKLDKAEQARVLLALDKIREKPELGKPLRAPLSGFWAERVGRLRIIYQFDSENVCLLECRERAKGWSS